MDASQLELHAHLKIRPGQLEGFKKKAAVAEVVGSEITERHATIRFTSPDRPVRTPSRL